ncbi:MAG TPA: hypothetical protein ENF78_00615 [Candidatus Bathyarchaeota archaeon]|nr:hypothetical protein [Candidatus Bathyarchaeota archaeon]
MSSATSKISSSLIRSLPPDVLSKAIDKIIDKVPPSLVVSALKDLVRESFEKGIKADLDLALLGLRVRGSITVRSPP